MATSDRTQGKGMKLHTFRSGIRIKFFTERMVGHWNRLPRDVTTARRLPEFKNNLDKTTRLSEIWIDFWLVLHGAGSGMVLLMILPTRNIL